MSLNATMATAIDQQSVTLFTAVLIELDGHTISLLTTAGFATFDVDGSPMTFEGSDPIYGTIAGVTPISSSMASESPRVSVSMMPPSIAAIGSLAQPLVQGSPIRIWEGVLDELTGMVIGTPKRIWKGFLDTAKVTIGGQMRVVEIETATVSEKFLTPNEAARLTPTFQALHFPGQTGLRFNVAATNEIIWGKEGISSSGFTSAGVASGGSQYGGGGGQVTDVSSFQF